jgi:hypothetical protein
MPKNRRLPEGLLSKLRGKGTMSEILDIERARLLKQSAQDMERQLGPAETQPDPGPSDSKPASGLTLTSSSTKHDPRTGPEPSSAALAEGPFARTLDVEGEGVKSLATRSNNPPGYGAPAISPAGTPPSQPETGTLAETREAEPRTIRRYTEDLSQTPWPLPPGMYPRSVEGLSAFSRVVGDDLSELGTIFRHSPDTALAQPRFSPDPGGAYYATTVEPALPFTAQRNLLSTIRRLTLGWGTMSCQITLELLSNISGIRNLKTLRKWLADLHTRNLIRYTPVHGDLRGSVVTLTPPPEVRAEIEHCWREKVGDR